MKAEIHPDYHQAKVSCACGNTFEVGAAVKELKVDVCSACHPFYTGSAGRLVDTLGRVERFNRKYGRTTKTS